MRDPLAQRMGFLLALWVATLMLGAALSPHFAQVSTVSYLLQYVPVIGVLALGQTLVMLSGGPGIDLSVGSTLSLTALAVAALHAMGAPIALACVAGLALGVLLGAVNATLVTVLGVPSLMATLATFFAYGGLALALTGGAPIGGLPEGLAWLAQGRTLAIPNHFWAVFAPLALVLQILLTRTRIGAHIHAAGNDERAAYLAGVEVARLRFALYCLSGLLAAVGAILTLSWFQAARPDAGRGMELMSVTIVVLGGTHIFGGTGRVAGTVLAVLIVVTLQAGLQLANISQAWQLAAVGALLIGSVVADDALGAHRRRRAGRPSG